MATCFRCTAPANNLDSGHHMWCSQAHTELLVEEFELGMLWDAYGLVGDVVVCILLNYFGPQYILLNAHFDLQPFTNGFP